MSKITIDVKDTTKASRIGRATERFIVTFHTLGADMVYTNVVNPVKFILEMVDESCDDITGIQYSKMA